jgi:hypothetical protein
MSDVNSSMSYKWHDSVEDTIRFVMLTQFVQDFCEKPYTGKINESDIVFLRELNAPKEDRNCSRRLTQCYEETSVEQCEIESICHISLRLIHLSTFLPNHRESLARQSRVCRGRGGEEYFFGIAAQHGNLDLGDENTHRTIRVIILERL